MKNKSTGFMQTSITTVAVAAAFCAETYISSGWKNFTWSPRERPLRTKGTPQDKHTKGLKSILKNRLECNESPRDKASNRDTSNTPSLWIAPYRQFPEVPPEGDSRGKGDYEYFSYISSKRCGRIASNYGAFKQSPADIIFQKASKQSLRNELLLAQELGYKLFALDTRKILLSTKDRDLCREHQGACKETSDDFIVVDLKEKDTPINRTDFLLNSTRIGIAVTLAQAIEIHSTTKSHASKWHDWEYPDPRTVFRWNKATTNQPDWVDILTPIIAEETPANLQMIVKANPLFKSLHMKLLCTQGEKSHITLIVEGHRDISEIANKCLPKSAKALYAISQSNAILSNPAEALDKTDSRQTSFGFLYRLN